MQEGQGSPVARPGSVANTAGNYSDADQQFWGDYLPIFDTALTAYLNGEISQTQWNGLQAQLQWGKHEGWDAGQMGATINSALEEAAARYRDDTAAQDAMDRYNAGLESAQGRLGDLRSTFIGDYGIDGSTKIGGELGIDLNRWREIAKGNVRSDAVLAQDLMQQERAISGGLRTLQRQARNRQASSGTATSGKALDTVSNAQQLASNQYSDILGQWSRLGAEQVENIRGSARGLAGEFTSAQNELDLGSIPQLQSLNAYRASLPQADIYGTMTGTGYDVESLKRGWAQNDFANFLNLAGLFVSGGQNATNQLMMLPEMFKGG
jgi:hypothetical protein